MTLLCHLCDQPVDDGCTCGTCKYCGRPKHACAVVVDERFPEAARDAYLAAGLETAAKCDRGQGRDLYETASPVSPGWNLSRAVFSDFWNGDIPTGLGPTFYRELEKRRMRHGARA